MARSVLVVDDDALFRRLAVRILVSWGYAVVGEAGTVGEALTRTSELTPDTVLADVGLPDGDGFALTYALRALPHAPQVVLISSDSDAGNGMAASRVGASGFVPKDEFAGGALQRLLEQG